MGHQSSNIFPYGQTYEHDNSANDLAQTRKPPSDPQTTDYWLTHFGISAANESQLESNLQRRIICIRTTKETKHQDLPGTKTHLHIIPPAILRLKDAEKKTPSPPSPTLVQYSKFFKLLGPFLTGSCLRSFAGRSRQQSGSC